MAIRITPIVMALSAMLKVGQFGTLMKSTTSPRRTPGERTMPVDQVPDRPAEHQGQRVGHDDVGRPAGRADDVDDHDHRQHGQHRGEAGQQAEGPARVAGQAELQERTR